MNDEADGEVVPRLFAEATTLLEDAHEAAVAGQAAKLDVSRRRHLPRTLEMSALTIAALARACRAMLKGSGSARP